MSATLMPDSLRSSVWKAVEAVYAWLQNPQRSVWHNTVLTVLLMQVALAARLLMAPVEAGIQYVTFFPAVTLAAIFGGYRMGLLAMVMGLCFATYIFVPPYFSLSIAVLKASFWSNVVFFTDCVIISYSIEAMHRFRRQASARIDDMETLNATLEYRVKERTAELRAAKEVAEAASRAKSQFLSRISHELRTPLNAILGYAQLLESEDDATSIGDVRENVRIMLDSGWSLLRIVDDLLDFSAIEAGKLQVTRESVEVRHVVSACFEDLVPLAARFEVSLESPVEMSRACVYADPWRLRQVLGNLISNAVRYNRSGGKVSVACTTVNGRVRIAVTDTGIGIDPKDSGTLFDAFSRLHYRSYEIDGAGIGLAIARQMTELMQGEIGVESTPGRGSTFWVEFPAADAPGDSKGDGMPCDGDVGSAGRDVGILSQSRRTILYIEDNPTHVGLMRRIAEQTEGIELLCAMSPAEGLTLAERRVPELILCDIGMPDMNGFGVLEHLRRNPVTQGIPVVAVSAHAVSSEVERGLNAGFAHYLTKPFKVEEVRALLQQNFRNPA